MKYPLAKNGVFRTIQGEGHLLGLPMTFVRLAGCSVGCPLCDTDYRKAESCRTGEILDRVRKLRIGGWIWITGGEPTDHDLTDLICTLHSDRYQVALATAGHRKIDASWRIDFLSVSPHDPAKWVQDWGTELKLVPGLGGWHLKDFDPAFGRFEHHFVSPCEGKPETVIECQEWLEIYPGWRMTVQAHKQWKLP